MGEIKVVPLGAGQDVGRSCILVSIGGRNIMLDCGMHMGYTDERRFPDFSYITRHGKVDEYIDCVLISHFHLDHCGALPYLTEMVGYNGPVIMSHPTRAICPILLEDFRKVTVEREQRERKIKPNEREGNSDNPEGTAKQTNPPMFTSDQIKACMRKVRCLNLRQVLRLPTGIEIKAYYAGHVLGAVMFYIRVGQQSVLYTGDFNMTPDRHLGSAWVDLCRPDLLITESTYATTVRDSKRSRERDLLRKVHECVERGGKVLIPVFALGRAQELCILLESYWDRMQLNVPMYFSVGLAEKANAYYKLFISWTNEKIRETFVARNMFDFRHISPLQRGVSVDQPGGMVVFATPGMLHAGQSLSLFRKWAPFEQNMLIVPGYCVAGTVGWRVLNGAKRIEFPDGGTVDVRMRVEYLSFSAHADARGIMKLVRMCEPRAVMLVHGENAKMNYLQRRIQKEFGIECVKPANGETATVIRAAPLIATCAYRFLKRRVEEMLFARDGASANAGSNASSTQSDAHDEATAKRKRVRRVEPNSSPVQPIAVCVEEDRMTISEVDDAIDRLGLTAHEVRFTSSFEATFALSASDDSTTAGAGEAHTEAILKRICRVIEDELSGDAERWRTYAVACNVHSDSVTIENSSVLIKVSRDSAADATHCSTLVSWSLRDELLGSRLLKRLKSTFA